MSAFAYNRFESIFLLQSGYQTCIESQEIKTSVLQSGDALTRGLQRKIYAKKLACRTASSESTRSSTLVDVVGGEIALRYLRRLP